MAAQWSLPLTSTLLNHTLSQCGRTYRSQLFCQLEAKHPVNPFDWITLSRVKHCLCRTPFGMTHVDLSQQACSSVVSKDNIFNVMAHFFFMMICERLSSLFSPADNSLSECPLSITGFKTITAQKMRSNGLSYVIAWQQMTFHNTHNLHLH